MLGLLLLLFGVYFRSWGAGIIPHFHHKHLGSSGVVRGHKTSKENKFAGTDDSACEYVAGKADLLLPSVNGLTPGMFVDGALYNSKFSDTENIADSSTIWSKIPFRFKTVTFGPSVRYSRPYYLSLLLLISHVFRFRGFKSELSMPLNTVADYFSGKSKLPLPSVHFGVDFQD
jgi:hypothetical protein